MDDINLARLGTSVRGFCDYEIESLGSIIGTEFLD